METKVGYSYYDINRHARFTVIQVVNEPYFTTEHIVVKYDKGKTNLRIFPITAFLRGVNEGAFICLTRPSRAIKISVRRLSQEELNAKS